MKKVVERLQRENENLKKTTAAASPDRVAALERENAELKVDSSHRLGGGVDLPLPTSPALPCFALFIVKADMEKQKSDAEAELASKLESKTRGLERVVLENETLRRDIRRVSSSSRVWCRPA